MSVQKSHSFSEWYFHHGQVTLCASHTKFPSDNNYKLWTKSKKKKQITWRLDSEKQKQSVSEGQQDFEEGNYMQRVCRFYNFKSELDIARENIIQKSTCIPIFITAHIYNSHNMEAT